MLAEKRPTAVAKEILEAVVAIEFLAAVALAAEVEPQLEDVVGELRSEPPTVPHLPRLVHDLERNVFVRGSGGEAKNRKACVKFEY